MKKILLSEFFLFLSLIGSIIILTSLVITFDWSQTNATLKFLSIEFSILISLSFYLFWRHKNEYSL